MLISTVQQSDSVIHMHAFIFIFFSIMVYHRILNIAPCAIQQDLFCFTFWPCPTACGNLSSLARDQTHAPCIGKGKHGVLTTG